MQPAVPIGEGKGNMIEVVDEQIYPVQYLLNLLNFYLWIICYISHSSGASSYLRT